MMGIGTAHYYRAQYETALDWFSKILVGDVSNDIMDTCMQFHGGWGYIEEFHIARAWRDARLFRIGGGTSETMKYYAAKLVGL